MLKFDVRRISSVRTRRLYPLVCMATSAAGSPHAGSDENPYEVGNAFALISLVVDVVLFKSWICSWWCWC